MLFRAFSPTLRPTFSYGFQVLCRPSVNLQRTNRMLRFSGPATKQTHSLTHWPNAPRRLSVNFSVKAAGAAAVAGIGLGLSAWSKPVIQCEPPSRPTSPVPPPPLEPPPQSNVSLYELSFGTVCGICAGVFVKKGVKAVAFILGGVFVLLQYFGSISWTRVDWSRIGSRFESLFYTTDASGVQRAPSLYSLWNWLVNFLLADFQPRASFLAGFALGLRVG